MTSKRSSLFLLGLLTFSAFFLASCGDDDEPDAENVEEIITDVTLTFTPAGGGTAITATAIDPDGEGVQGLMSGPVNLAANTTYTLTLNLENKLENESISEEVEEEADEHMFFFGWAEGAFTDPTGNGNIDNRTDDMNYSDSDDDGLPLGLETSWTTAGASEGSFRIILKHQPDIKSATSTANDGESDLDITWTLNIQ